MYRHGQRQFLLLFPDGSRRVVPVAWTDAAADGANQRGAGAARSLASITDLLRTRTIVDALLRRIETEEEHATGSRLPEDPAPGLERVDGAGRRAAHRRARRAGKTDGGDGATPTSGGGRQSEEMAVRWAAVTFRETEKHYRRITGYEHLWMLKAHLDEEDGVLAELQKAG